MLFFIFFPPSERDPQGIRKTVWDEIREEPFVLPEDKRLTVTAYRAGLPTTAYVEPVTVGYLVPSLPIFLAADYYVSAPLEVTYEASCAVCPEPIRELLVSATTDPEVCWILHALTRRTPAPARAACGAESIVRLARSR